jgi:hypothetical protein
MCLQGARTATEFNHHVTDALSELLPTPKWPLELRVASDAAVQRMRRRRLFFSTISDAK